MSSSKGNTAEHFWEYCSLSTKISLVLLVLKICCKSPSSWSGQQAETQEWQQDFASVIYSTYSVDHFTNVSRIKFLRTSYWWINWRENKSTEVDPSWCQAVLLSQSCHQAGLLHKSCSLPLADSNFHVSRTWNAFKRLQLRNRDTLLRETQA